MGSYPKPVHERDSFDPGLLRLVVKQRHSPFCCVASASTQAYRGLSLSEDVRLFDVSLVMMEKPKTSFLSALYGPNHSLSPGDDNQVFKQWHYVK